MPKRFFGMPDAKLEVIIKGRVQGVGFRYFVEDAAISLGVKGFVKNMPDGISVEVVAEGDKPKLESLLNKLKVGPRSSRVEEINEKWDSCKNEFSDFKIRL